jgi:cysteine desulfurase
MNIYLDNAATTRIDERVLKAMLPFYHEKFANPSSIHFSGQKNYLILEKARQSVAKNLGTSSQRIIFTSGATEANNFIIKGIMEANTDKGKHLIISSIEHPSVYELAKNLKTKGFKVDFLPVNKRGIVETCELKKFLRKDTVLVSIMAANNEIGTKQALKDLIKICHDNGSYFHSDIVQAVAYEEILIDKLNLDFASLSAHKFHGPTGIGVAVINPEIKINPLIIGGGQENAYRSGTYNLAAIVGLTKALEISCQKRKENRKKVKEMRDYFLKKLKKEISNIEINGCLKQRLPNNLNVLFKNIEGEAILIDLSNKGIEVSTGSACSAINLKSSYVLSALGLKDEELNSNIRFSLSRYNTKAEIDYTILNLKKTVKRLKAFSPIKNH